MENINRTVVLHAQEIRKDKQVFIACSAEINHKWYKIKFTKECEHTPKVKGLYEMTINFDDCSVEKGKPFIKKDGTEAIANSSIWVRKISNIRKITEEELKIANRKVMSEIFDGSNNDELEETDDLPF